MERRALGRTGLAVSVLGLGCGNVGGLLVRGTPAERERTVARALELGVTYFDTAPLYGDGRSEEHLGAALRALRAQPVVGTKVRLQPDTPAPMGAAVARSAEASLRRLGLSRVDLLQLHNPIVRDRRGNALGAGEVLQTLVPALGRLVEAGKVGGYGITALGEAVALREVVGAVHTAQVCYNLLNPTAARVAPAGLVPEPFDGLLARCAETRAGVIVIRALAGGALSGETFRHPLAASEVAPIASGPDYATDVRRARVFRALVEAGHAESLVEAALRFPLGTASVSTILVGVSSLEQLEYAAACVARGPLPPAAVASLPALWERAAALT